MNNGEILNRDSDTYQVFNKIKFKLIDYPDIRKIYEEKCQNEGISPRGSLIDSKDIRVKRDRYLNYAFTVYISNMLDAKSEYCRGRISPNTEICSDGKYLFIFIIEKSMDKRILFNCSPLDKLPRIWSDEMDIADIELWESALGIDKEAEKTWINCRKISEGYIQNTHSAFLSFIKNNDRKYFEDTFIKVFNFFNLEGNIKPPLNTYCSMTLDEHSFEFIMCEAPDIPSVILDDEQGIRSIRHMENIPIILISSYKYNNKIKNRVKSW